MREQNIVIILHVDTKISRKNMSTLKILLLKLIWLNILPTRLYGRTITVSVDIQLALVHCRINIDATLSLITSDIMSETKSNGEWNITLYNCFPP